MERRKFLTGAAVAGVGATALSAPAIAQERIEIKIVSTWPRDLLGIGISAQRLAQRLGQLSNGKFDVKYFAAGERVKAFDSLDHVAEGKAEAYIGADYYWIGKHPAMAYFTAVPFGMTFNEIDAWMKFGGGEAMHDKVLGQFGLKGLPCGNTGVQMGGWFNKEINSPDDLKGLKMRIPGLGGNVLSKLGVSTVSLPGGQIFENLNSKRIDATEWIGPYNDYAMRFFEAAKYYYYPGMHEPGAQLTFGMNKAFWDGLSSADQALIRAACIEENANSIAELNAKNGEYLKRMIDENGVELRRFSEEVYDAFGKAAQEVFEETKAHSPLALEVHTSFENAMNQIGAWMAISDVAYTQERNRVLGIGE